MLFHKKIFFLTILLSLSISPIFGCFFCNILRDPMEDVFPEQQKFKGFERLIYLADDHKKQAFLDLFAQAKKTSSSDYYTIQNDGVYELSHDPYGMAEDVCILKNDFVNNATATIKAFAINHDLIIGLQELAENGQTSQKFLIHNLPTLFTKKECSEIPLNSEVTVKDFLVSADGQQVLVQEQSNKISLWDKDEQGNWSIKDEIE